MRLNCSILPSAGSASRNRAVDRLGPFLLRQSRLQLFAEVLALCIVVGAIDYLTGYDVTIYPFYSIPILIMVWFGDMRLATGISVLCTVAWWWADKASGHYYPSEWLRVWEAIMRFAFFGLVMFAGWAFKKQRDNIRARLELLERAQQLEQEIITISEREQERIGRDLHDDICQYLAAIGFSASMLKQQLESQSHALAKNAGDIASLLQDAAMRTRDLARGLSPVDRDEGGLNSALEELASTSSKLAGVSCTVICPENVVVTDNIQAIHLFRIAQEALSNALKHGRAKSVVIALEVSDGACSLRVSDDGVGFNPLPGDGKGMGLKIMRYRARMISGKFEIQPNSPFGTVVVCTIEKGSLATVPATA
jgi:signal transduction histidine kinase